MLGGPCGCYFAHAKRARKFGGVVNRRVVSAVVGAVRKSNLFGVWSSKLHGVACSKFDGLCIIGIYRI